MLTYKNLCLVILKSHHFQRKLTYGIASKASVDTLAKTDLTFGDTPKPFVFVYKQ